jgi:ATP-binding cassette subfamily C protein
VDRVVVFEHGQVAEEGDHEALLAQGGLYAALYGKLRR